MQKTKKSMLASGLAVLVCVAMLIGTTFAWFTDSVTNKGNTITAGSLKIDANAYDIGEGGLTVKGLDAIAPDSVTFEKDGQNLKKESSPIITEEKWEPGRSSAKLMTLTNTGSLYADVKLDFSISGELTDALWYDFVQVNPENGEVMGQCTKRPMSTLPELGEKTELAKLAPGATVAFVLVYGMNEEAGNEFQGAAFSADVTILAKQATVEEDGFGNSDYDANAAYEWDGTADTAWYVGAEDQTEYSLSTPEEFAGFAELVNSGTSFDGKTVTLTEDMNFGNKVFQTINGKTLGSFTLDGAGHTISQVQFDGYIVETDNGKRYGSGLFGQVTSSLTVKNLTFENIDSATDRDNPALTGAVGIVCGYVYGDATFENVHIRNCTVTAEQKCGGMIGFATSDDEIYDSKEILFRNCSVSGMTFKTQYQCANYVGYAGNDSNHRTIRYENIETVQGKVEPILYYSKEDLFEQDGVLYLLDDSGEIDYAFDVTGLYHNLSYRSMPVIELNGKSYHLFDCSVEQ